MYLKHATQLSQPKVLYPHIWEHLAIEHLEGALTGIEKQYNRCVSTSSSLTQVLIILVTVPNTILCAPCKLGLKPEPDICRQISFYLAEIYTCDVNYIKKKLPTTMNRWGKVHITNAGDNVHAQCAISQAQEQTLRDASFIQVRSLLVVSCLGLIIYSTP